MSARRCSARVGFGTTALTSAIAGVSFSSPDGSPVAWSRTIVPFGGSGVAFVMRAAWSAFEFAQMLWPSKQRMIAGRSGTAASSCSRVGAPFGKGP